ncbi:MAG: tetratricopeptide repeat protein [Proteobacteria bacterium]|nr:tetratricopeptide repeat protein [Pseudomonadota bacterium]MDA0951714.1 tetratricopeptide repeat protein [Pseudomonadota bacterium]
MVLRARLHRAGLVLAATVAGVITLAGCRTGELIARADETGHPVIAQTSEDETLDFAPASGRTLPLETTPSGAYLAAQAAFMERDMDAAADYLLIALAADAENKDIIRQAHFAQVSAGRVPEALPLARKLVVGEQAEQLSPLTLAVDALDRNDAEAAYEAVGYLPLSGYGLALVPLFEAWIEVARGNMADAVAAIGPYDLGDGFDALRAYHVALIEDMAGNPAAADAAFRVALTAQDGGSYRVVLAYGRFLENRGKSGEAREVYEDFLAANPSSLWLEGALAQLEAPGTAGRIDTPEEGAAEALFAVAGAAQQGGSPETALAYAQLAAYLAPDSDVVHLLIGDVLELEGRHADAIAAYRRISAKSPLSWTGRLRTAINLDDSGDSNKAIALLRQMEQERPDRADALIVLGDILRVNERWDEAVAAYDDAYEREGGAAVDDWKLHYVRGIALERSGDWERAEADLLRALEIQPGHPFVLNYLGYTWVDMGIRMEEALAMIEQAVVQRPTDGFIIDSLGWAYYRMGRYEDAAEQLELAVEYEPSDPVVNDHLGDAYWKVGRRNEARVQWRRALSLAEDDAELSAAIEAKLQSGLGDD